MRYKSIVTLEPGDVISSDVYDFQGRVVVAGGVELTAKIIQRLEFLGLPGAYVSDPVSEDIEIPPMISPELRNDAKKCIAEGDIENAIKFAELIVEEVIRNGPIAMDMIDLRTTDGQRYEHTVNVAVLSCTLGLILDFSEEKLNDLCLAALLHGIRENPVASYTVIQNRTDISAAVKESVLTYDENVDGSGFPMGKKGADLSKITKILHVVDRYDNFVTEEIPKHKYPMREAVEYLMGGCGTLFDLDVVKLFVQYIPIYPLGTEVHLSNGVKALVVDNRGLNNLRPKVRTLDTLTIIDLSSLAYANLVIED